jgi:hypothetical protein
MLRIIGVCVAAWLTMLTGNSGAQETFDQKFGKSITDGAASEAIKLALTKIQTATCESDKPCARASAEEFSRPPISLEDGRAAMVFAIKSALAQWCGLDWKRSFLPMIAFGKGQKKMSDRQLQLMTLIHGDFQGRQLATYMKSGQCSPTLRSQLDAQLPKLNR